MKILVFVKEVPDMKKVKFDSERGTVSRASAPAELNPFDESALQCALDIKKYTNAAVITVSMGPLRAEETLRDTYARGANDAVLVSDKAFGGSDTFATANVLAAAAKKIGFDLIICGEKSVDGDTAQVGAEVAELLDIPHCYYADKVELKEDSVKVEIENLGGEVQVRTMKLPSLVGVTKNAAKLKLPTVNRKLESYGKSIKVLTLNDLDNLTRENVGFNGSPTKVAEIHIPKNERRESLIFRENLEGFLAACESEMKKRGVL